MKKVCFILFTSIATNCFCQTDRKLSAFLSFQVNKTLYDRTISSNSGGIGFGLQTNLNTKTWFKPTLEVNADAFGGTKEFYTTLDGKPIYAKSEVFSAYIGAFIQPAGKLSIATTFGPSFYNTKTYLGIRPSICYYPSKSKKWTAKGCFTNIFQRDDVSNESFGYFSFALALKLF